MADENLDNRLEKRKIKPTAMRQLVLQILTEQKTAISLPELENKFEQADKSTLYRTLKTFEDRKLIHSIDDGSGALRYAVCNEKCDCNPKDLHVHFYCNKCKKTYCLTEIPVPEINLPVNFTFENVNIVVKGVCANCRMDDK